MDVADRRQEARGDDHVHAWHAHQPSDLCRVERCLGDQPLDLRDLAVQELDLAHAALDALALLECQVEPGQPLSAFDTEQIADRWATDELTHQHRVDLVLRPRARMHKLPATRQTPAHHPRAQVGPPDRVQRPRRQEPRQRPCIKPVGLCPGLTNTGIARADHQHLRDMRVQDPRDLPRVPSHLKRHPIIRAQAPREQLDLLRLGIDPPSRANLAVLNDRDLTEIQVHIQPNRPHDDLLQRS